MLWLPLPVTVAVSNFYVNHATSLADLQWHLDMQLGAFCLGMATTVSNPIVYGLAIKSFRIAFKKLWRQDWGKLKQRMSIGRR